MIGFVQSSNPTASPPHGMATSTGPAAPAADTGAVSMEVEFTAEDVPPGWFKITAGDTTAASQSAAEAAGVNHGSDQPVDQAAEKQDAEPEQSPDGSKVSFKWLEGWIPLPVRWAPAATWQQRLVYVHPDAYPDDLKWAFRGRVGADVSTFRCCDATTGRPWGRAHPLVGDGQVVGTAILLTPSFQ